MAEEGLSWRHVLALLVTALAGWMIWHGTHLILTEPPRPQRVPVIHVSLAKPPAPPAPPVPKPVPKLPKPIAAKQQKATRTPIEASPHAVGPPVVTNAPVASQNAAPPSPPAPPAPPAQPVANVSLESTYIASVHAALEQEKRYPMSKDAVLQKPVGTVTVWFVLNRAGELQDLGIDQSAGSILDRAALETVRRSSFPPIPAGAWPNQEQHRFQADLHFSPQ